MTEITYPCFIARLDGRGRWYWTYYAREDEPVASGVQRYTERDACEQSVRQIRESPQRPLFFLGL